MYDVVAFAMTAKIINDKSHNSAHVVFDGNIK